MRQEDWAIIRPLFDALVDLPPGERAKRLAARPPSPAIAREVEALLASADASGDFLERPLTVVRDAPAAETYRSLPLGTRIGAFAVEALVGRGGQGEVYRAARADGHFQQVVALKLLRPEAVLQAERFRAERQILAGLDHPAIARLVDGGTTPDGRPYLAMEFVAGRTITDHCALETSSLPDRLRLMRDVCAAVAHAHRQLVVHRDIKPANVLVTDEGVVKLLDFGIARMLDRSDGTATEAILTPDYAAPEQFHGQRITTATDVYALGALLFELLTGRPPWSEARWPGVARLLGEEPPRASRSVASAMMRELDPAALEGDLDAIVAKAMRTRPEDRYESVTALSDELARHLTLRPVLARAGSGAYRLRRFAQRNRGPLATALTAAAALAVGSIGYAAQSRRARAQRAVAEGEAERASAVRESLLLMLRAAGDAGGPGFRTAKQVLDGTAARLRREAGDAQRPMLRVLGELYAEMDDFEGARLLFEQERDLALSAEDTAGLARARLNLAVVAVRQGRLDEAERFLRAADAVWATDPERFAKERAEADGIEAGLLRERGQRESGIARLHRALHRSRELLGPGSQEVVALQHNLGVHYLESSRLDEAEAALDEAARLLVAGSRQHSVFATGVANHRAGLAFRRGRTDEAEAMWREAIARRRSLYGPSAALAAMQLNLGRMFLIQGRNGEALSILDEAAAMILAFAGPRSSITVMIRQSRALALGVEGRLDEAGREITETLAAIKAAFGARHLYGAFALSVRAQLGLFGDDVTGATADLAIARDILVEAGEAGAPHLAELDRLGAMLAAASAQPASDSSR